jgi:hypothetical protein
MTVATACTSMVCIPYVVKRRSGRPRWDATRCAEIVPQIGECRSSARRSSGPPRRAACPLPAHRRPPAHPRSRWSLSRMPTGPCLGKPKRNARPRLDPAPPGSPALLIAANRRRGRLGALAFGAVDVGLRGELPHCRSWQLPDVVPHGAFRVQGVHVVHRARWVIRAAAVGAIGSSGTIAVPDVLDVCDDVSFW